MGRLCGFGPGAVQNQRRCHVSKNIARNTCAHAYPARCPRHHGAHRTRHLPAQTHQRLIVSTLYHRHFIGVSQTVDEFMIFLFLGGGSGLFKVHKYLINLNKISVANVAISPPALIYILLSTSCLVMPQYVTCKIMLSINFYFSCLDRFGEYRPYTIVININRRDFERL